MKRIIYILFCLSIAGCNYLEDYSQDLVIAKSVQDVDELLLGSGYLRYNSPDYLAYGDPCYWIHLLDDDVNSIIADRAAANNVNLLKNTYYGYFAWQWEVGRNYQKTALASDAGLWNTLYSRINIANIILSEIRDMDKANEQDEADAWRVQGEAYFLRAQFYFFLVNIYGDAYAPSTAAVKLGVPLKLTEYVEHDPDKKTQFERATVQRVYEQIVSDLEDAVTCFEKGSRPKSVYRASREAAFAKPGAFVYAGLGICPRQGVGGFRVKKYVGCDVFQRFRCLFDPGQCGNHFYAGSTESEKGYNGNRRGILREQRFIWLV